MPIDDDATNFLKYAFAETKDLCKHFLTVVSAILVFSLSFAEKIVKFDQAESLGRGILATAWAALLLAIVSCGFAICYVARAGGAAAAGRLHSSYWQFMRSAIKWMLASGGLFVLGLAALIIATVMSVSQVRTSTDTFLW